jgi:hypothetical protein
LKEKSMEIYLRYDLGAHRVDVYFPSCIQEPREFEVVIRDRQGVLKDLRVPLRNSRAQEIDGDDYQRMAEITERALAGLSLEK